MRNTNFIVALVCFAFIVSCKFGPDKADSRSEQAAKTLEFTDPEASCSQNGGCQSPPSVLSLNVASKAESAKFSAFLASESGNCTGLPPSCKLIGDTGIGDAEWLECYRDNPHHPAEAVCKTFASCYASSGRQEQIKNICCSGNVSDLDKLLCIGKELKKNDFTRENDYVCRHFAQCMDMIAGACGISSAYEGGARRGRGHAWTEQQVDSDGDGKVDCTLVNDPYNDIYYCCSDAPPTPTPPPPPEAAVCGEEWVPKFECSVEGQRQCCGNVYLLHKDSTTGQCCCLPSGPQSIYDTCHYWRPNLVNPETGCSALACLP